MPFNNVAYRRKRLELGLSQFDITSRTRRVVDGRLDVVRPECVSKYETGRTQPNVDNFLRLALAIETNPLDLWIFEGEGVQP